MLGAEGRGGTEFSVLSACGISKVRRSFVFAGAAAFELSRAAEAAGMILRPPRFSSHMLASSLLTC